MYSSSGGSDLWDTCNHTLFFFSKKCIFFETQTHIQIDILKKPKQTTYKMFQNLAIQSCLKIITLLWHVLIKHSCQDSG